MDKNDMKKLLAGLSLVALIGGAGLTVSGCATTGSNTAGTADKSVEADRQLPDEDLTG